MREGELFLTGGTGLIGSQVLERALAEGYAVRALVRGAAPAHLRRPGVRLIHGDLSSEAALAAGLDGATHAVHCAAKVGDWGDPRAFARCNVDALRTLTDAALRQKTLRRFVAVSSLGVYAARDHFGTDESEPPALGFDAYTRTKAEAEGIVRAAYGRGLPAVTLRPGFVYGPRDRHVLPGLAAALRSGLFAFLGTGDQLLDNTGVHNITEAVFLAFSAPDAVGEVFNITDDPLVSRRTFVAAVADGLGLPVPRRSLPLSVARPLAHVIEGGARLLGRKDTPLLSLARYKFLALHLAFSIDKARRILGYHPPVSFEDGIREALAWFRENGGKPA
jgi:nucleoside-diphosphate-sugar epimerase